MGRQGDGGEQAGGRLYLKEGEKEEGELSICQE